MNAALDRRKLQLLAERLDAALVKVAADRGMCFVDKADAIRRLRARVTVGDLTLIPPRYVVRGAGRAVRLGPVEFGVLNQLIANPGKVVSYERILNEVWGHRTTTENLWIVVSRLRGKIGDGDPVIDTVCGGGYVLRAPGAFLDPDQDDAIRYADLVLNPLTRSAKRGDRPLTLAPARFGMLERFMRTPGRVVAQSELASAAARPGCEPAASRSIPVQLARLRRELGEPQLIHNEPGFGYVLEERPSTFA